MNKERSNKKKKKEKKRFEYMAFPRYSDKNTQRAEAEE